MGIKIDKVIKKHSRLRAIKNYFNPNFFAISLGIASLCTIKLVVLYLIKASEAKNYP
jgi:hypothetical protein